MKQFLRSLFVSLFIPIIPFTLCFSINGDKQPEEIAYIDTDFQKEEQPLHESADDFLPEPLRTDDREKRPFNGFVPTTYITEQTEEDRATIETMRPLFFERRSQGIFESIKNNVISRDPDAGLKEQVSEKAIKEYGAQEFMLLTEDNIRISSLYFERENAPLNILYVVGYFRGNTPSKEWAAPFAALFPHYNLLSFDWRGYAESDGHPGQFDTNAYKDVQAAIDFLHEQNDKPIVVVGFCLGAALALKATVEAQNNDSNTADAFVISCTPTYVNDMKERVPKVAPNWFLRLFYGNPLIQNMLWEHMMGDLVTLEPIEMIKQINKPLLFEYYAHDIMVPWQEGIDNFNTAPTDKKMFTISDIGEHVRIHSKAPYQYHQTFINFLKFSDILHSHP